MMTPADGPRCLGLFVCLFVLLGGLAQLYKERCTADFLEHALLRC